MAVVVRLGRRGDVLPCRVLPAILARRHDDGADAGLRDWREPARSVFCRVFLRLHRHADSHRSARRLVGRAATVDRRISCGRSWRLSVRRDEQLRACLDWAADCRRRHCRRLGRDAETRHALVSPRTLRDALGPRAHDGQRRCARRAGAAPSARRAVRLARRFVRIGRRRPCNRRRRVGDCHERPR